LTRTEAIYSYTLDCLQPGFFHCFELMLKEQDVTYGAFPVKLTTTIAMKDRVQATPLWVIFQNCLPSPSNQNPGRQQHIVPVAFTVTGPKVPGSILTLVEVQQW